MPWPDVAGFEHGKRVLGGDGTGAPVGVEHGEPEAVLPQSRHDELRLPGSRRGELLHRPDRRPRALQLEEEQLAGAKGSKPRPSRPPEVDLADLRPGEEEAVPV
ncbi:MAG: hypothetical protein ACRDKX_07105, partial [Solirubrobacterales bacterium]